MIIHSSYEAIEVVNTSKHSVVAEGCNSYRGAIAILRILYIILVLLSLARCCDCWSCRTNGCERCASCSKRVHLCGKYFQRMAPKGTVFVRLE